MSTSDGVVGGQNWTTSLRLKGSQNEQLVNFLSVGNDFLKVLDMQLKEGRGFTAEFTADTIVENSNGKLEQDVGSAVLDATNRIRAFWRSTAEATGRF